MTQTETRKRRAGGATPGTWGPAFGGRYDVRERLGAGGPATTYRAFDLHLGREVRLKVVTTTHEPDGPSLARLGRDLEAVAALDHPNVVAILDYGIAPPFTPGVRWNRGPAHAFGLPDHNAPYVATELIPGQTLEAALSRRRLPPEPEALAAGFQIACALEAVHARGIVHGDLNPGYVLLDERGTVRVDGFGLSWILHPPGSRRLPDAASDLAALGALLNLLLTGAAPPALLAPASASPPAGAVSARERAARPSSFAGRASASSRRARQRLSPQAAALLDRLAGREPSPLPGAPQVSPADPGPLGTGAPFRTASELRAALAAVLEGASALPPPGRVPMPVAARFPAPTPAPPQRTTAAAPPPLPPPEPVAPPGEFVAPPNEVVAPPPEVVSAPVEVVVPAGGPAGTRAGWPAALVLAPLPGPAAGRSVARPVMQPVPHRAPARAPAAHRPGGSHRPGGRTRRAVYLRLGALLGLAGASLLGALMLATLPAGAPGESQMARPSPAVPTAGPAPTPSPLPLSSAPPVQASPALAPGPTAIPEPPPGDPPPPPAPAPAPAVIAAPAAPAPVPPVGTGASSPDQAVRSFYALVGTRQFDGAAGLWSARMARTYPPGENIAGRFSQSRALTVLRAETVAYDPGAGRATVAVEVLEVVGAPPLSRRYTGTWQVVRGGSGWLLDQPNLRPG